MVLDSRLVARQSYNGLRYSSPHKLRIVQRITIGTLITRGMHVCILPFHCTAMTHRPPLSPQPVGLQAGRAVFVCATYVHDYERHIRDILTRNSFSSAVLYTAMSDAAHGVQAVCGVCRAFRQ
jgi:hypothetical protein